MRRLLWAAIGVALISMLFANCKKEEEPTYMVQVTAAEGGTVEGQNGEYKEGETVVFTAVPADGYYFTQWSDGNTDNPRSIVTTSDISLTAKFIGVNPKEGGVVETKKEGNSFVFTAVPSNGYYFSQWSDGNTDNPRTIKVGKADITLTAEFVLPTIATVDLGLTSGNLWATCNVGAINPWNYGYYYAWGETQTKDNYSFETYKYCNGSNKSFTKYNVNADYGTVDNKTILEPSDDAATVVLGAEYSMPTDEDWKELDSLCYWVWTNNYNGTSVAGYIVYKAKSERDKGGIIYADGTPSASYSLSDSHIFLPASGWHVGADFCSGMSVNSVFKIFGVYWSASLEERYPDYARCCIFYCEEVTPLDFLGRCVGYSVRPVKRL